MVKPPLISVIMACYNSEKYVDKAVQSIINQTYTNWELLICDDQSKDNTLKIIEKINDPRIKIFKNEKNLGYLKTCNRLFSSASGDYITFQDSDDFSHKERLSLQLNHLLNNANLGAIGTQFNFTNLEGTPLQKSSPIYPTEHSQIITEFKYKFPFRDTTLIRLCLNSELLLRDCYSKSAPCKREFPSGDPN